MAAEQRQRLLDAAIDYVANNGITELSLRSLAEELGTSHRMLIHHFGSKDALWVAIIREVEARQRAALADRLPAEDLALFDALTVATGRLAARASTAGDAAPPAPVPATAGSPS
jgi:AcrR family transcriptional regulator